MKKILSLMMALTLVMGVNAAPITLKVKKAPKSAPRFEQVQKQTVTQPATVKHAPKHFRHMDRSVIRKVPMAGGVTFTFAGESDMEQSQSGISLAIAKGEGQADPAWNTNSNQLRVYANNTITVSGSGIIQIELTCGVSKEGKEYADMTADCGSLVSGGESTAVGDFKTDTWTGSADKVVFTLGTGQREIKSIVVYTDGDTPTPPTPPTPSGDVEIKGLQYADAYYAGGYWDFDLYNDYDYDEYAYIYPEVYFSCNEEATSKTSIVGTYSAYYAGYWSSVKDSAEADYEEPVGSLTVTCVEEGVYNFVGSFEGQDGKTYTWNAQNVEVLAYDADNDYDEITLTDGGTPTPPTPGDTTALTSLDAFELAYYASYSEEGAYNYSLNIYDSQDENYVPYISFDIYTEGKDEFTGIFSVNGGNLGLDYSAFFPDAESEGEYLADATVTIKEGEGDELIIEGIFSTEDGAVYTLSVAGEPYIYDAEHPYEPQEASVFTLTAEEVEVDNSYVADYGELDYYFYMEDGSYIALAYLTENTSLKGLPDGTYEITEDPYAMEIFAAGYDYAGMATVGCYYEDVDYNVYYLVSGTVTFATDGEGSTTITVNATSAYGSTFTVTGTVEAPQPTPGHTIVIADYADVAFTTMDGAYTVATDKNGGTDPAYNENGEDLRLYAKNIFTLTKNTKDGPMTKVVFNISTKGLTRQAEIAVSTGKIVEYDMDAATVTWEGEASEIVFTVGEKNVYGSDGKTKAGQFDFTSIDIEGGDYTALYDVKAAAKPMKVMTNGHFFIHANGVRYNILGTKF